MKKVLISVFLTVSSMSYTFASSLDKITSKDNSDKITIISKSGNDNSSSISSGKARVQVQEIENDDFGLEYATNTKEIEVISTKFADDNFVYVKEKKDLIGYALQLASFSDLKIAKEYALNIVSKGEAERRQLFIYTATYPEKTLYKVYFGLLKSDELAREKQRNFLSLGYSPFVKQFR